MCPPPRPDRLAFAPICRAFFWVPTVFFTFRAIDVTRATLKISRMYFSALTGNKWLRGILWVVGGIAVLWGLAWMLVPTLVKNQLGTQKKARQFGANASLSGLGGGHEAHAAFARTAGG